jgi:hypothetical protein
MSRAAMTPISLSPCGRACAKARRVRFKAGTAVARAVLRASADLPRKSWAAHRRKRSALVYKCIYDRTMWGGTNRKRPCEMRTLTGLRDRRPVLAVLDG